MSNQSAPQQSARAARPRLSIVIVVYNMQRAAPRSITSLLPPYQLDVDPADYEIIVVENGSSHPLDAERISSLSANIVYHYVDGAPPSPARAINLGVSLARGEVLCVMVDGAHMLTPRVLASALEMFDSLRDPIVLTPPFFLGPGPQMVTVSQGYDEAAEDALLAKIEWPDADGYRLFEIGVPYRIEPGGVRPKLFWFVRLFESNCLFMRRSAFDKAGGCDERFDLPGGGILLPSLYRELSRLDGTEIVQLLGEASFHQVHGGVSTNTTTDHQKQIWENYLRQYEAIRGEVFHVTDKPLRFYGHMPNQHARSLMITG